MKKILFFLPALKLMRISACLFISLFVMLVCASGQAPPIQWQKCLGGANADGAYGATSIKMTSDGGYVLIAGTDSNDGDVSGLHVYGDIWIVKLSPTGIIQWQKCLGGSGDDYPISVQQTTDGGYIVLGTTRSGDGDVSGWHSAYDISGWPLGDYWVVKLNSVGAIQWQKCLGGSQDEADVFPSIQQTTDGGYILIGATRSNDGDVAGWHAGFTISGPVTDCWVIKLSSAGAIQWQKCLGGSGMDVGDLIYQTPDGGYILAGGAGSNNGDVVGNHGGDDIWLVKLSQTGIIQWQKCLGGSDYDYVSSIQQATDGGYIVAGSTWSNNGDVSGYHGGADIWVVKLSQSGIIQWQKCLGGSNYEDVSSIQQTTDGGHIVAGSTWSNNGDVSGYHGSIDLWVVKLTQTGVIQWQKCLGGTGYDVRGSLFYQQTTDDGYIVSGGTTSNDGDVSGWHPGYDLDDDGNWYALFDCWIVKLNSAGAIQWQKCLGGSGEDFGSIQQTTDGGYLVAGGTSSNDGDVSGNHGYYDAWVVKLGFNPLPIKLTSIAARNQGSENIINWSSASEDPGESYELERSADGIRFEKITSIDGKGQADDYEYTDASPLTGINYYRLRLIHNSGTPTYSKIVSAFVKTGIELRIYPNPADDVLYVQLLPGGNGRAILFITDAAGKIVMKKNISNTNQTVIDISKLPAGFYTLRYQDGERNIIKTFIVN